jgi:hypothetical protein
MIAKGGMGMPRVFRVVGLILNAVLWVWTAMKFTLDMVGRASVVNDATNPQGLTVRALDWIFQTPWYVPGILAGLLTLVLIVVLLRNEQASRSVSTNMMADVPEVPPIAQQSFHQLDLEFSEEIPGCLLKTHFNNGVEVTFYRIKVGNNTGKPQKSCRGRITGIKQKNIVGRFEDCISGEQFQLTWAIYGEDEPLTTNIPNKQTEFLDVFYITSLGRIGLATKGRVEANSIPNPFGNEGEYLITIHVTSDETVQDIELLFAIIFLTSKTRTEFNARVRRYLPT